MAFKTLADIRGKVRRLTRSPSTAQLSDANIDDYINTFLLYDFPVQFKEFNLRKTFTFYTVPYVDTYSTNTTLPTDPLYNFKNLNITAHTPMYIGGVSAYYTQLREVFFSIFPMTNTILSIGTGDGVTTYYAGVSSAAPLLSNSISFSTIDSNNAGMVISDTLTDPQNGEFYTPNEAKTPLNIRGVINYPTGTYAVRFPSAPKLGADIALMGVTYQPGRPTSILYYDGTFTLRPVPDKCYPVSLEVDVRPTELLLTTDIPELEAWSQYIAIGASIKVLQDRMDMDSVQLLWPEFFRQEDMVRRPSLCQSAQQSAQTIYKQGKLYGAGWFFNTWPY